MSVGSHKAEIQALAGVTDQTSSTSTQYHWQHDIRK